MKLKKLVSCIMAAAIAAGGLITGNYSYISIDSTAAESYLSAPASTDVLKEAAYVTWTPVSGADGYNVYCKPADGSYTQLDSMLIRQYNGYFRADAVGLKPGSYVMKVVPTVSGKEDTSKAVESEAITVGAHDRSGFGFVNGTSSGAYNEDGTLKSDAVVVYVTDENKDTVTAELNAEGKGNVECVGVQNIITAYKKGKETRPLCLRFIGNITDPANMPKGDLMVDTATAGMTIEGIGNDATFNGFGLVLKNCSNVEVRNIGFMNCNSEEGDDCGLQQGNDHCWVHNCDFFYGDAGSDADQVKGDGALDTKKSHYITHSYNHFWDNGKCNLQGASSSDTSNYITYHHNWYDHSDSRHPRVRVATVHVYNNYYDGNAKYGIGSTTGSSVFAESNYFRNCKYPMLISKQGSEGGLVLSGEAGGIIKAYGNFMTGQKDFISYSDNNTEFDAYVASSRDEQVPGSVTAKEGGSTYNNFDTDSGIMYSYTADAAENVPAIVTAAAGRIGGGDFRWTFDNSVDDESYDVNTELKAALVAYDDSIIAIGSGFTSGEQPVVTTAVTTTAVTEASTAASTSKSTSTSVSVQTSTKASTEIVISADAVYCSPTGSASAKGTKEDPTDVVSAISMAKSNPGITIYLLGGTYSFGETILIEEANSGTADARNTIMAYPGEEVVWDFSSMEVSGSNRGVVLDGAYWYFKGFEIKGAGDNGMLLSGDNNIIEMMVFNDNQDTGLQISRYNTAYATIAEWLSNNLVLNCTSKNNCDNESMENADGFAAKLTCGEGNVFDGCMAYNNSDDGWDLYAKQATGPIGVVTIRNCIAFRNGYTEFGEGYGNCDGNGFKLGGDKVGVAHVVENCLAFENLHCGFTDNDNPKLASLTNCTAYNNDVGADGKPNFSCYRCTDDGCDFSKLISYVNDKAVKVSNDKFVGTLEDSVFYNGKFLYQEAKTNVENGYKGGTAVTLTDADFISVTAPEMGSDFHKLWRNEDGTINTGGFLETTSASVYADLGVDFQSIELPIIPVTTTSVTSGTTSETTTTTVATTVSVTVSETESTTTEPTTTEPTTEEATLPEYTGDTSVLKYGDVNLDKSVDSVDVVVLNKYLISHTKYPLENEQAYEQANTADYEARKLDSKDSMTIINCVLGILSEDLIGRG